MEITRDTLFGGRLVVYQRRRGYRFSVDSVILAGLTRVKDGDVVLDLGCGCGVVGLILLYRHPGVKVIGVEIQESLYELADMNIRENGYHGRMILHRGDFRDIDKFLDPESVDLVVSNPPYRRVNTGRLNPDEEKAVARHELFATIDDVFSVAARVLKPKGRVSLIYPAFRLDDLIVSAWKRGFRPKRLTVIYSDSESPGMLVHAECVKGAGQEVRIAPPFCIYERDSKNYTPEMQKFYEP
ncbi:tRNA1(Val) (adenine(37)-N6)-methyltransferase [Thermodesulforhabdus norvegica]|uniref:tRNA1(Val) A37 N6-methylase TrmN6 n=1 Tax=Thermodesulforhabdus norvegica TaxID=39841 RepID=A0A1I4TG11_9BACT|nr:methyltransferase domain-containing protein [Thermodesulforhabdus norvegica]SFM75654.1 tRNA1(Val) A37 N6-methylase TrmN6 [Thermodesulforhabdus norvegica]